MPESVEVLSEREIDVLKCVADGSSNKEVASHLSISPYTVKTHLRNIYAKLDANSRTEAIRVGMERGFLMAPNQAVNGGDVAAAVPSSTLESLPEVQAPDLLTDAQAPSSNFNWQIWGLVAGLIVIIVGAYLWQLSSTTDNPTTAVIYSVEEMGNKWSLISSEIQAKSHMATSSVGLSIYQIGGVEEAGDVSSDVVVINTVEKTVTTVASKPTAVSHATAAVLYGEIYVVGGQDESGDPTGLVEVFSPAENGWRPIASLPKPLSSALSVSIESLNGLFVLGGHDGETAVSTFMRYDLNEDRWLEMPEMPIPRTNAAGGVVNGNLYIVGGENESGPLSSCSKFDLDDNSWSECSDMQHSRTEAKAVSFLGRLYVFGGQISAGDNQIIAEIYEPGMDVWQPIASPASLDHWSNWEGLGVSLVGSDIFVGGGRVDGRFSSNTYIFSPFPNRVYLPATSTDN